MNPDPQQALQERVLIVAPTGCDAALTASFLTNGGMHPNICQNLAMVVEKLQTGCGAVLLAQEALETTGLNLLSQILRQQPSWSDIPVIIVAGKGQAAKVRAMIMQTFEAALNLSLLERPLHPLVLTSTLQVALRGRRRQYQTRDLLFQRELDFKNLRRKEQALAQKNQRLHLLSESLASLLSSTHPEGLVGELFEKIAATLPVDSFFVYLLEDNGVRLRLSSFEGITPEQALSIKYLALGEGICGVAAQTRLPIHAASIQSQDEESSHMVKGFGLRCYSCHPLLVGERLLGTLSFGTRLQDSFSEDDLHYMRLVSQYLAVALDRARAGEELRESEARLRTALDAGKLGAWEWDIPKNKITWSARVYEFFGVEPGTFSGTAEEFYKMIHPEDAQRIQQEFANALRNQPTFEFEFRALRPDGSIRWLFSSARMIWDDEGKPQRVLGGAIDLTERKATETALQEAQRLLAKEAEHLEKLVQERTASLQETAEQLETFCYTVAHDLRAPLRAQEGFAYALLEGYGDLLDQTAKYYLERIIASANNLNQLVTDLLTYARVSREELQFQRVHLGKIVEDALAIHDSDIQARKARITKPESFPTVQSHEASLRLAVANLISNALKFTQPGQAPEIRFAVEESASEVRLYVEDEGLGIAPEHHVQIFGIFQRLHKNKYPGTGIGLALVAKAVQRMKGQVGVESALGKGSRFWIELPKAATIAEG